MSTPSGANPSDAGQVPGASGGQVPPPSESSGQVPGSGTQQELTPEQLRDALRRVRESEAATRIELQRLKDAQTAREREQMTAADRAKAEAEDYKKQLETVRANARRNALEAVVTAKAGALGIAATNLDLAILAVERQATFGDDDKPQNVDELLRQFVQSHPGITSASQATANTSTANAPRLQQGTLLISKEQLNDYNFHRQFAKEKGMSLGDALAKGVARLEG